MLWGYYFILLLNYFFKFNYFKSFNVSGGKYSNKYLSYPIKIFYFQIWYARNFEFLN